MPNLRLRISMTINVFIFVRDQTIVMSERARTLSRACVTNHM